MTLPRIRTVSVIPGKDHEMAALLRRSAHTLTAYRIAEHGHAARPLARGPVLRAQAAFAVAHATRAQHSGAHCCWINDQAAPVSIKTADTDTAS